MRNLQLTFRPLHFIVLIISLIAFFGWGCKKSDYDYKCLTCTAKYSTGEVAGTEEACGDEAQRAFKEKYNYAATFECK